MNKKLRILFCSEDYGSLEQNIYLIKILSKKKLLDKKNSIIVCNNIFEERLKKISLNKIFSSNFKRIKKKISQYFVSTKIDMAIVGMSIKPYSLDYELTKFANSRNIKTLCIQDFWGNIGNYDDKVFPKYLFVADMYANKLTQQRIKSKIITSGLPKYLVKKPIFQFSNKVKEENLLILGQPSYVSATNTYLKFIDKFDYSNLDNIYYLPHPAEKKNILFNKKIKILDRKNWPRILSSKTIVISPYSTLSYDILFSALFSNKSINLKLVFLVFKPEMYNYTKKIIGDSKLPLTNYRNIFQLLNYKNFGITFHNIIKKKYHVGLQLKKYFKETHKEKIFLTNLISIVRS
jgi:hypothetical protein